jgi:predicted ATPase
VPTSFINREAEVGQLMALLPTQRLITVTGAGGMGKTRLAVAVAEAARESYPDGVFFVDLGPLTDPDAVAGAVAVALGIEVGPNGAGVAALARALQPYTLLLVLDTCEHLTAGVGPLVEALLAGCPRLTLLATSREALGVAGEFVWRVPPLALPAPGTTTPAALLAVDAVRLFVDRAVAARPGFTLTPANAEAVARICQRLGGIPLAIELAASRMAALTAVELDSYLAGRFRPLGGGPRRAPPRQRSLQAVFDWSYDLLTPAERTLFARVSIFAGGWTLAAAAAICSDETVPESLVLDLLVQLMAKSLVHAEPLPGVETHYQLLEPIRAYAGDRLARSGEAAHLQARHRDWYLALAERAGPGLERPDQRLWLQRLTMEEDNLRAALAGYQATPGGVEPGLRLAAALGLYWFIRAAYREGRMWLESLLARPEAAASPVRARAGAALGLLIARQGYTVPARTALEESVALAREQDDRVTLARALTPLALVVHRQGDREQAHERLHEAGRLAAANGDVWLETQVLIVQGVIARHEADFTPARARFAAALTRSRAHNDPWSAANALIGLADVAYREADYARATPLYHEAMGTLWEFQAWGALAEVLTTLGHIALVSGDAGGAQALYGESVPLYRAQENRWGMAQALIGLGDAWRARGQDAQAEACYAESLDLFQALGQFRGTGWALHNLGALAVHGAAYEQAAGYFWRGLGMRGAVGHPPGVAACLAGLGACVAATGQPDRAAMILGAAAAYLVATGTQLEPVDQAEFARYEALGQRTLTPAAWAAAFAAGRTLSLEEALTQARAAGGPPAPHPGHRGGRTAPP